MSCCARPIVAAVFVLILTETADRCKPSQTESLMNFPCTEDPLRFCDVLAIPGKL